MLTVGAALLATMDTGTSRLVTCSYMLLIGLGLGCLMQMATTIAQNSVEMRDMGAAMSSTQLFRTLGGSLAVAAFGSMFTRVIRHTCPAPPAPEHRPRCPPRPGPPTRTGSPTPPGRSSW
ncbi:MFS transporter [Actinoallomurus rhizosphaericola]|uniref:hypothetical protein n=1 Tax=Actinoallomurus rhizosphaericola TaxID=2952536 RepID=UPI002090071E|nr:hypothetical protein [Actinoallomurus rhizosphaericola]MCO5991869.1 hypothetical protein [Actinoallomurus rhizosphaericola]